MHAIPTSPIDQSINQATTQPTKIKKSSKQADQPIVQVQACHQSTKQPTSRRVKSGQVRSGPVRSFSQSKINQAPNRSRNQPLTRSFGQSFLYTQLAQSTPSSQSSCSQARKESKIEHVHSVGESTDGTSPHADTSNIALQPFNMFSTSVHCVDRQVPAIDCSFCSELSYATASAVMCRPGASLVDLDECL